jgi:hypothetical protein
LISNSGKRSYLILAKLELPWAKLDRKNFFKVLQKGKRSKISLSSTPMKQREEENL